MNRGHSIAAVAALLVVAIAAASAQPSGEYYRNKTVNLLVGSGEGGGFDLSAQLVAPYLTRYLPGHPNVVVQNMPGASGLRAAEFMFNVAPGDGTTIAITQPSIVLHKVLNLSARFDPRAFTWVGRLGAFVTYGVVWHMAPVQTIEQARQHEIILGAVGPSGPGAMLPAALNQLAGTKIVVVKGYRSAAEMGLAIERGEIHGSGSASYEFVSGKGWLDKKFARLFFTIGHARSAKAPEAPTVIELARDERGRNIMRLGASASEIGRSIMAPPGLAPERAAMLRSAFDQVVKDKDFVAESLRRGLEVEPLSADGILKIVADDMSMSVDVVDGLRAIMEPQK